MYDNIASLVFKKGGSGETMATAMKSSEGEIMEFRTQVAAEGRVEEWMTSVLMEMLRANRLITKEAIFFYAHERTRCVLNGGCGGDGRGGGGKGGVC